MKKRFIAASMAVVLSLSLLAGCGTADTPAATDGGAAPASGDTIKIGAALALTGGSAEQGNRALRGVRLAVEEANAAGGINGQMLEVVSLDDKADPKEAANVANKLAADESVMGVIGHINSSCTLAGAPIYNKAGLVQITTCSSSPKISDAGDYTFRVWNSDKYTARFNVEAILEKGYTKVGIVYENNDYGLGAYEVAVEVLGEAGITPLVAEAYLLGETKDFSTIITKMKDAGVEAVFAVSDETELPMFMKQSHQLGFNPFVTSTGTYNNVVVELGGQDVEGLYGATFFDPSNPPEKIAAFFKTLNTRFADEGATEKDANAQTITSYVATQMIIEGLKQNGVSREGVKNYLTGLQDFETPMGPISFDENGDTVIPLTRMVIENGTFVFAD